MRRLQSELMTRAAQRPIGAGVRLLALTVLFAVTASCERQAAETIEVLDGLRAENEALQEQVVAVGSENSNLRSAVAGREPWPRTIELRQVGAFGGTVPYVRSCPRGEALSGFVGKAGALIDAMSPVCTPVDLSELVTPDGDIALAQTTLDPIGGSRGGNAFERLCPAGLHITSFAGRAGEALDAIRFTCADLSAAGFLQDGGDAPAGDVPGEGSGVAESERRTVDVPAIGGGGGNAFERICPDGWVMVGVSGRHSRYIDSVSFHCAPLES